MTMSVTRARPRLIDAATVLKARAEARALLYYAAELTLHEAVDALQESAVASGLVAEIGQDAVQQVIADAFAVIRMPERGDDLAACKAADDNTVHAAGSTVEALMYSLRQRGVAALRERDTLRRLSHLSTEQVRDVIGRLMALRQRYPAVNDDLLFLLGEQLR